MIALFWLFVVVGFGMRVAVEKAWESEGSRRVFAWFVVERRDTPDVLLMYFMRGSRIEAQLENGAM